jgi:hypothetical protein
MCCNGDRAVSYGALFSTEAARRNPAPCVSPILREVAVQAVNVGVGTAPYAINPDL